MKIFKFKNIFVILSLVCVGVASCIKNDLPYPVIELTIDNITGQGFVTGSVDYSTRIVTLELEEQTNLKIVTVDSVSYTEEAELSTPIVGVHDLRDPLYVTLSFYQDYDWTIMANQDIERYFKVSGQIGDEVIDVENQTMTAYVTESKDLLDIEVKSLKIGPADSTVMSPALSDLTQFITYRTVTVKYHGLEEKWKLYVEHSDVKVAFTLCEAWANCFWLEAAGDTSLECGFRYKVSGDSDWIDVSQDDITYGDGVFSANIEGTSSSTDYEFIAYSGDDVTVVEERTSDVLVKLENGGFEEWSQPSKSWLPYSSEASQYWSTGNEGATTLGDSYNLTTPLYSDVRIGSSGEISAKLQSKNVLVKFAAGNLFVGRYISTDVTNGIVGFGQSFTSRPVALKGWVKYNSGVIDIVGSTPAGVSIVKDQTTDIGMIYIALGDWTPEEYGLNPKTGVMVGTDETPVVIHTAYTSSFFDPYGDNVIAYGELELTESVDEWTEFVIPLNYSDKSRIPTNLIIVNSASKYGDYFTGSTSSYMILDDFELVY
ncbi:MAG: PCMD domain-containing protein [Rikenellaceae bacterium]